MQILTVTLNPALDMAFEVEKMKAESKLRATPAVFQPGGGGINVARAAKRLGGDVTAMWLGGGPTAMKLASLLDAEGIAQRQVTIAGEVRMSVHVEERSTTDMYRFVLPGPNITPEEAASVVSTVATTAADFVVLSGSMPPGLPSDFYRQLAACAADRARIVVDTSGESLDKALCEHVFLAKPNKNELGRLLGKELADVDDVIAAAREIIATRGVHALAVSMAEDGIALVTRDTAEHVRPPKVQMVSAVGAGDSTVAGLVVGLARGHSLRDAARLGVAAGTATVLQAGTTLLTREDAERIYGQLA